MKISNILAATASIAAFVILAGPSDLLTSAFAQMAPSPTVQAAAVRVRGTIVKFDGGVLTVHAREGRDVSVMLPDNINVSGIVAAKLEDIRPGVYIGATTLQQADGTLRAAEIHILPETARGAGEGQASYDLLPNSSMTNATVSDAVDQVDGRTLTIKYHGTERKVVIPPRTPIVTYAPASRADLVAGAGVFVSATRGSDGTMRATRLSVGKDGLMPPM